MFRITLSKPVLNRLKCLYSHKNTVLEYGSGGSTLLALQENKDIIVYSCETDPSWLCNLSMEISRLGYASRFHPIYTDIGQTGKWGHPDFSSEPYCNERGAKMINSYIQPWKLLRHEGIAPNLILIDGRFRVAAFLASAVYISQKTTIIFDDYVGRLNYHIIESISKPVEILDRAAIFELDSNQIQAFEIFDRFSSFLVDSH